MSFVSSTTTVPDSAAVPMRFQSGEYSDEESFDGQLERVREYMGDEEAEDDKENLHLGFAQNQGPPSGPAVSRPARRIPLGDITAPPAPNSEAIYVLHPRIESSVVRYKARTQRGIRSHSDSSLRFMR